MKVKALFGVLSLSFSLLASANAAEKKAPAKPFADADHVVYFPVRGGSVPKITGKGGLGNLRNHGGPTITSAKVVFIFWGPSFSNPSSPDYAYAQTVQAFRNQYGTTPEYNVITQYSGILQSSLGAGTPDWFDSTVPPVNVTDAIVQGEVLAYLATHTFNASTIYEVVIPSASYSSSGSSTSCGGPSNSYCAYHGSFTSGVSDVKYSIEPYPSCSGCQVAGWTDVQNQEHFISHETREAVTDPDGNAWYDLIGYEADDKCAWSPTPFIGTGGFSYQYEWSNATRACVKTR